MTDLQKEINAAFAAISAIPVTGEDQERAVMAKDHLRKAYKMAAPTTPAAPKDSETEDSQDSR